MDYNILLCLLHCCRLDCTCSCGNLMGGWAELKNMHKEGSDLGASFKPQEQPVGLMSKLELSRWVINAWSWAACNIEIKHRQQIRGQNKLDQTHHDHLKIHKTAFLVLVSFALLLRENTSVSPPTVWESAKQRRKQKSLNNQNCLFRENNNRYFIAFRIFFSQ